MKKAIVWILILITCLFLCACGEDTSFSGNTIEITTHKQAVDLVKKGDRITNAAWEIHYDLGFKKYNSPSWGTCVASENSDGSWEVTLCGSMSGYTDDYNNNYEHYSFEYKVSIGADGAINWSSGKTVKIDK